MPPKHFEHIATWTSPNGLFEFLDYDLQLRLQTQIMTTKEAVTAYTSAGFTDIYGQPIAAAFFQAGIPKNVQQQGEQSVPTTVKVPFAGNKNFKTQLSFRYHQQSFRSGMSTFPLDPDPRQQAGRIAALLKEFLTSKKTWPLFAADHAYPEWMRLGYSSMAEFMAGYDWTFQYDQQKKTLSFNGDRHVYDVLLPITESGSTILMCNFYPTSSQGAVFESLDWYDTRLYETD
jgi:hypothetical protein